MKNLAILLTASALGLAALAVSAEAGQRTVNRTGPYGGTMTATQTCTGGGANCQRTMEATGAYGRTVSGSATVVRAPGSSQTQGTVVGPNGGVYNRTVTRTW